MTPCTPPPVAPEIPALPGPRAGRSPDGARPARSFGPDTRGGVAVFFGIACVPLIVGIGVAADYSRLSSAQAAMQVAADSGALAGARVLADSPGGTDQDRVAAARRAADGVAGERFASASRVVTPSLGERQVKVDLSADIGLSFLGILNTRQKTVSVSATAVFQAEPGACMVALGASEPVGIGMQGSPKISGPKCKIVSNATTATSIRLQGASAIASAKTCAVGQVSGNEGRSSPPPVGNCAPGTDPFAPLPSAASSACSHTNLSFGASTKKATLLPGVYCGGLSVQGTDITLLPGTYEFRDGPLSIQGSGSFTGAGVALVLRGAGATLQVRGTPQIDLSAHGSGALAGRVIVAAPTASPQESLIQGSPAVTLRGTVHLPNGRLKLLGSPTVSQSGPTDRLLALSFDFQGSPEFQTVSDGSQYSDPAATSVRLVQ